MSKNLSEKLNQGIEPKQFIAAMTKNKEKFEDTYRSFAWEGEDDQEFFKALNNRDDLRCLIVAADWCGDVVRNIPVVFRVLEETGIPTEVLIMENHLDLIDQFLTLGGRAIPKVIFTDTGGFVLGDWGPRPKHVQAAMIRFREANPDRSASDYQDKLKVVREEMAQLYGEGTGYHRVIVRELRELLSEF